MASARSTASIARTTPAQKPRGWQSRMVSGGFCGRVHGGPDVAKRGPRCQAGHGDTVPLPSSRKTRSQAEACAHRPTACRVAPVAPGTSERSRGRFRPEVLAGGETRDAAEPSNRNTKPVPRRPAALGCAPSADLSSRLLSASTSIPLSRALPREGCRCALQRARLVVAGGRFTGRACPLPSTTRPRRKLPPESRTTEFAPRDRLPFRPPRSGDHGGSLRVKGSAAVHRLFS